MIVSWFVKRTIVLFSICISWVGFAQDLSIERVPYSTDSNFLTIWNGQDYVPLFVKAVNLGIAKPGTFPGELSATKEDYNRWLTGIREAGFNVIRIYTLHFPVFYEALNEFNQAHPNEPILFFQGVWLEEEIPNYNNDLFELTETFENEMRENVSAVHGNISIDQRAGKAYGDYTTDVSNYLLGYITAREIHPNEVWTTNASHPNEETFTGNHFAIQGKFASEAWMCQRLNYLVDYEHSTYSTMRPVSFSSWPSLDPLHHKDEKNRYEDSVSIDLSGMERRYAPAGYFASYHAYPYYPDFMSQDSAYLGYNDYVGQNSYLGYLTALKEHYKAVPLIIAEFGSSSSWGKAHYSNNGIDHGGSTEVEQGNNYIRMFKNIQNSSCGGGIQFAWMDEWFKRTWITDPMDYNPDRRILWHNLTAAEQNFGLIGFRSTNSEPMVHEAYCSACPLQTVLMSADYDFLRMNIQTQDFLSSTDTLIIAFDTYSDSLGEQFLPNGDSLPHRSEFFLQITNESASLMVTEAYDLFGNWHGTSAPVQKFQSTQTDHQPWRLVRWKNNNTKEEVQYIGKLGVNRLNIPMKSTDAVRLDKYLIQVRIPWTLLNFSDPSMKSVIHDDRATSTREDTASTGIHYSIHYNSLVVSSSNRFTWQNWNTVMDCEEYKKASYYIVENELKAFDKSMIAFPESYRVSGDSVLQVGADDGVLKNDWSLDGKEMEVFLTTPTKNGWLSLQKDGSFNYQPMNGFVGKDTFEYVVTTKSSTSNSTRVIIETDGIVTGDGFVTIYPNPNNGLFSLISQSVLDYMEVFDLQGHPLKTFQIHGKSAQIDIQDFSPGAYMVRLYSGGQTYTKQILRY